MDARLTLTHFDKDRFGQQGVLGDRSSQSMLFQNESPSSTRSTQLTFGNLAGACRNKTLLILDLIADC